MSEIGSGILASRTVQLPTSVHFALVFCIVPYSARTGFSTLALASKERGLRVSDGG